MSDRSKVQLIYTGGTVGMMKDPISGVLKPFNFNALKDLIPELHRIPVDITAVSFDQPIDSSDMHPGHWRRMAEMIEDQYDQYDGFVILHGSDTMAYTASALSFMLEHLAKPVILTGSQLPIETIRTDGKENIITSIEIAGYKEAGRPLIQEVCIYFEYQLYRGNRTHKYNAEHFQAFDTPNYPILARAGVHIKYDRAALRHPDTDHALVVHKNLDANVVILKMFPGISQCIVESILGCPDIKGVVLESYGAGNTTTAKWFIDVLRRAIDRGIPLVNVTQCQAGAVEQGRYETSAAFNDIGVIGGYDITTEAAVTKLMWALGSNTDYATVKQWMEGDLRGEMTMEGGV